MASWESELDASGAHMRARLAVLEARIEMAMDLRDGDPSRNPGDRFRGLYLRPDDMRELLAVGPQIPIVLEGEGAELLVIVEDRIDLAEANGEATRLRRLQRAFGLDPLVVELLLLAVAPDLDPRFERFYGYLHDDVSRRRVSVGLALALTGQSPFDCRARAHFGPLGPLISCGLVVLDEPDRPFLTRSVRVPDRVASYMTGDDTPDPAVEPLLVRVIPNHGSGASVLARGISAGVNLAYIHERPGAAGSALAAAAVSEQGLTPLCLDLGRLPRGPVDSAVVQAAGREAILRAGALIAGPIEVLAESDPDAVRIFTELPCCTLLVGGRTWDPTWARSVPLIVRALAPTSEERAVQWRHLLNGSATSFDPAAAIGDLRLTPTQVLDAVTSARQLAVANGRELEAQDLRLGARAQNAAGLERVAQRIEPSIAWSELVLPAGVRMLVEELGDQWRHRETVLERWRMGGAASRRRGLIALFSGPPGTGKTMAAEVVAGEFGLDLYVINLATVVDKYIGETEKNLERIFSEAERVNGLLFFDEADALFGKRSEVKDARDRYANIETAYLLQRLELFDGIAILATNLKTNLDEAFVRRLDAAIDFPQPDCDARLILWDKCLGPRVPRAADLDLEFMAVSFALSGGNIRNIAVAAAGFAAARGTDLGMADLVRATHREYRKLGRLCVKSEFGPWLDLLEPQ